jgi:hypothetical protein
LEPQLTLGLLTDASGFPLQITAFEGDKAETQPMVPVIEAFRTAHGLEDVTVEDEQLEGAEFTSA